MFNEAGRGSAYEKYGRDTQKARFRHRHNAAGPFKYPIDDTDYKGKITFTATQEAGETIAKGLVGGVLDDLLTDDTTTFDEETGARTEPLSNFLYRKEFEKLQQSFINQSDKRALPKVIGSGRKCTLYLPGAINFADGVGYTNIDLNIIGNVTAQAIRTGGTAGDLVKAAIGGTAEALGSLPDLAGASLTSATAQAAALRISRRINSSVAGAISTTTGIALNPNKRASLIGPNLRTFRFTFKMIPTSQEEAEMVKSIVKFFREELYPEQVVEAGLSSAMRFPSKFEIKMSYGGVRVAHNILPSFLTDVNVVYNASGMGFHSDGNFQETDISLSFTEERTLTKREVALDNY